MTGNRYYQVAFLTPLVLPFLLMGLEALVAFATGVEPPNSYSGFLLMSVLFGGIPYLVFLGGFYWWASDKSGKRIHEYSYIAPIVYLIIFFFWLIFYMWLTDAFYLGDFFSFLVSTELWEGYYLWGKVALIVAYGYIFLINISYGILKVSRLLT